MATQLGLGSHDESHDPEAAIPLVGADCVQLLQYIPVASLPAYTVFLTKLLNEELSDISRGAVYSALRQAQAPSLLEKAVATIPSQLQSLCSTHCSRDTAAGLITGESCA